MPPEVRAHAADPSPRGGGSHRKSTQKRPSKTGTYLGALLATRATKKEYSGELGSQNDPKMEPEIDPKVIKKGSLHKNMKRHIWTTIYYT